MKMKRMNINKYISVILSTVNHIKDKQCFSRKNRTHITKMVDERLHNLPKTYPYFYFESELEKSTSRTLIRSAYISIDHRRGRMQEKAN